MVANTKRVDTASHRTSSPLNIAALPPRFPSTDEVSPLTAPELLPLPPPAGLADLSAQNLLSIVKWSSAYRTCSGPVDAQWARGQEHSRQAAQRKRAAGTLRGRQDRGETMTDGCCGDVSYVHTCVGPSSAVVSTAEAPAARDTTLIKHPFDGRSPSSDPIATCVSRIASPAPRIQPRGAAAARQAACAILHDGLFGESSVATLIEQLAWLWREPLDL